MTNIEIFENLTTETQRQLLLIAKSNSEKTLILLARHEFILTDDLDKHVNEIDDDIILDAAVELCRCSYSNSCFMFESIYGKLQFNINDILEFIDDHLSNKQIAEMLKHFQNIINEELNEMKITTIDDEFKTDLLKQLFDKYTSYQLEEKLKHLV